MTIKSDKWIRKMANEHGMIEPFEEDQVRYSKNNSRLISFGLSSYGYDVRCANEFKVFTNIHSAIVDPKSFDEKSFVDINFCLRLFLSFSQPLSLLCSMQQRHISSVCSKTPTSAPSTPSASPSCPRTSSSPAASVASAPKACVLVGKGVGVQFESR